MRWARWMTPLWPGLTQLWFAGSWRGGAGGCGNARLGGFCGARRPGLDRWVSCGIAWLASFAAACALVWTEWLAAWQRGGVWCLLLVVWLAAAILSFGSCGASIRPWSLSDARACFAAPNANT